jgi:hypothetical protein
MTEIINRDYAGAVQRGKENRANNQYNQYRNQLAQQEVAEGNLLSGRRAQEEQAAKVKQFAEQATMAAQYASQAPAGQTKQFIEKNFPFLVETYGPEWATATDDQVRAELQGIQAKFGVQAGVGPAAAPPQIQQTAGPNGSTIITRGNDMRVVEAPKPERGPARFRPMSPQEIQSAGLPPGTAAQMNDDTGQISVLSKRDSTGNLSQKDQTTAKLKLNTVKVAKKQLANIRSKFQGIKGTLSAGYGGQGMLPTEGGKSFDAAVDQMRSTLTALTRVPGVGAMSDYETKLDQSKFPTRQNYESVTEQQIADLEDMLALIENGYSDLLSGTQTAGPAAPAALSLDEIRAKYGRPQNGR